MAYIYIYILFLLFYLLRVARFGGILFNHGFFL